MYVAEAARIIVFVTLPLVVVDAVLRGLTCVLYFGTLIRGGVDRIDVWWNAPHSISPILIGLDLKSKV